MSAPNSNGRCKAGVQKQLSTTSLAPTACTRSATAAISTTSQRGLVGDSRYARRVLSDSADSQADRSKGSTVTISTPNLPKYLVHKFSVDPNTACEQTTRSPACKCAIPSAKVAAIPLAVATQRSAPSSAASRSSKACTVGLSNRL